MQGVAFFGLTRRRPQGVPEVIAAGLTKGAAQVGAVEPHEADQANRAELAEVPTGRVVAV
jgi:hypothetical protein